MVALHAKRALYQFLKFSELVIFIFSCWEDFLMDAAYTWFYMLPVIQSRYQICACICRTTFKQLIIFWNFHPMF